MTRSPAAPQQRTPDGVGCLVCYLLVVGVCSLPVLIVNGPDMVRSRLRPDPPDAPDLELVEAELAAFARAVAPELQAEIEALTEREADDRRRCDALADLLRKLGRTPADDHDFAAWGREREVTAGRLAAARRDREDRFLRARKTALAGK